VTAPKSKTKGKSKSPPAPEKKEVGAAASKRPAAARAKSATGGEPGEFAPASEGVEAGDGAKKAAAPGGPATGHRARSASAGRAEGRARAAESTDNEDDEHDEAGDEAPESSGSRDDIDDDIIEAAAEVVSDGDSTEDRSPHAPQQQSAGSIARLDPMQQYLREVQKHPLLTPDEEHSLAIKYSANADVAAAARLVTANLRLVVKIAYEYRRAYKNIMDLVQEGNIGLMQAVKRYDPYRGVKLSSYAAWWIRAYILRFILNNWRLVKLGTTQAQRKLFFNLNKEKARLSAMGIEPSAAEIARRLGVEEQEVSDMDRRLSAGEMSLDAPVGDSEGRAVSRLEMLPTSMSGPDLAVAEGEMQQIVKEKLADFRTTLKGKDIQIFDERLVAEDPLTLQELGDKFGISRERVRQLEARLTGRLREYLKNELGDAVAG
jgi:RNA polymerase sigma-32 factor